MSAIRVSIDFSTGQWSSTILDLAPNYANLTAVLGESVSFFQFQDFAFGYELRQGENIKQNGVFPPPGVRFISSDQQDLWTERLTLTPGESYDLWVWAENAGVRSEHTIALEAPLPPQPYSSWTWDGTAWQPPTPYPDDGGLYQWDEETLQWVVVEAEG